MAGHSLPNSAAQAGSYSFLYHPISVPFIRIARVRRRWTDLEPETWSSKKGRGLYLVLLGPFWVIASLNICYAIIERCMVHFFKIMVRFSGSSASSKFCCNYYTYWIIIPRSTAELFGNYLLFFHSPPLVQEILIAFYYLLC